MDGLDLDAIEGLLEVDEGDAKRGIILLSLFLQLVNYLKMIDGGVSCSKSCLFSWLVEV